MKAIVLGTGFLVVSVAIAALVMSILNTLGVGQLAERVSLLTLAVKEALGDSPAMTPAAAWVDCELNGETHNDLKVSPDDPYYEVLENCRSRNS